MDRSERADASPEPTLRGILFDQFEVGHVYCTQSRTVTEADIVAFAGVSGDFLPLHTDEEYARATPFRGRVAHGLLVHSIATGLAFQVGIFQGSMAAMTEIVLRFEAPVHPGDTIRLDLTLLEKDPNPGHRRGWMRFRAAVFNQREERVSDGEWRVLINRQHPRRRRK